MTDIRHADLDSYTPAPRKPGAPLRPEPGDHKIETIVRGARCARDAQRVALLDASGTPQYLDTHGAAVVCRTTAPWNGYAYDRLRRMEDGLAALSGALEAAAELAGGEGAATAEELRALAQQARAYAAR